MNKKLLTIAMAAAMAAPMAVQAEATIYGKLHMSLDYVDFDDGNSNYQYCAEPTGFKGWDLCSRKSRLGFKGSEDLGSGLKAIWKIETEVQLADTNNDINDGDRGTLQWRNAYLGLAGGWGTLLAGRHDTPLKMSTGRQDIFVDAMADYQITGMLDLRTDNTIAYVSPNWGGFTASGAIIPAGGSTLDGGGNIDADGLADGWSVAGTYSNGPFYAALAYEEFDKKAVSASPFTDDLKHWRAGVGWTTDVFGANFVYEGQDDIQDIYYINGFWNFGNNAIKGMYGWTKEDNIAVSDSDNWAVGLDHYFTKRTTMYVLYTDRDVDNGKAGDWNGFSLGMIHKF